MEAKLYYYDVFYEILGEQATAQVMAKNVKDAKVRFKKIYGHWKIIGQQRVGKV